MPALDIAQVDSEIGSRSLSASPTKAPSDRGEPGSVPSQGVGWLAILAVLAWPAVEAFRIISRPVHEVVYGDFALFELATRDAWDLNQLLGPSAHPGFHHPGPAMFYLLAPVVRLLEPGPGLYLGTLLLNAAALVAVVAFVWRRAGARVALWAAASLNLFCLAVDLDTLREPWNSLLLITPMLLFVVLWAGALARVRGAWLWAAVVGSFELQSHVTTAVFVAVMLALAGVFCLPWGWRTSRRLPAGWWRGWSRLTGFSALVLIWLPSTIELFRGRPNNLSLAWHWFRQNGPSSSIEVGEAVGIVLRSVVMFHSGDPRSPLLGSLTWWSVPVPPSWIREVLGLLVVLTGGALIGWLVRRQQWFAVALACAPMLAVPLAIFTVTRAGDDNYAFATGWLAFVPYVLLIALGVGLLTPRALPDGRTREPTMPRLAAAPNPNRAGIALLCVVALVTSAVTVSFDLRRRPLASVLEEIATLAPFAGDATSQLRPGDRWIGINVVSPEAWGVPAGVVVEVERLGYRTVIDPRYVNVYGKKRTEAHPVDVLFSFYLTSDPAGEGASPGVRITAVGDTVMTAWRPNG